MTHVYHFPEREPADRAAPGRGAVAHPDRAPPREGGLQPQRDRQGRRHAAPRGAETPHAVTAEAAAGYAGRREGEMRNQSNDERGN